MSKSATLTLHAYCGMAFPIAETKFRSEVGDLRRNAARRIRAARRQGDPVFTLKAGEMWEFPTPDDAVMISDQEGLMILLVPFDGMADDFAFVEDD